MLHNAGAIYSFKKDNKNLDRHNGEKSRGSLKIGECLDWDKMKSQKQWQLKKHSNGASKHAAESRLRDPGKCASSLPLSISPTLLSTREEQIMYEPNKIIINLPTKLLLKENPNSYERKKKLNSLLKGKIKLTQRVFKSSHQPAIEGEIGFNMYESTPNHNQATKDDNYSIIRN